jgi:hypothetical protein
MDNRIRQRPNFNMIFSSLRALRVLRGGVTSFAMPDYDKVPTVQSLRLRPRDMHRVEDPTRFNLANAIFSYEL